ncbi:MAG TPA: PorT family protein [Bacteroidetes bacterium]|nr:PorT family protein [Bacteroidota bacterium]
MKRISTGIFLILFLFTSFSMKAQSLSESAMKKVTIGLDVFTDIWFNAPTNVDIRTIQPSANTYLTYNFTVGKSKSLTFGMGLGIGNHNMYSNNGTIENVKGDTIRYIPVDPDLSMKRSKLSVTYLELPLELRFKSQKGFKVSLGLKLGYLIDSKEKYVGNTVANGPLQVIKRKKLSQLNSFSYSPMLRIGYKSFNLFFSYALAPVFRVDHGPQLHPMSLGITLTPF